MPAVGEVVLPGDSLPAMQGSSEEKLIVGPGIDMHDDGSLWIVRPGILREKVTPDSHAYWVDTQSRRYVVTKGDRVVGVITQRLPEGYKVDLGSSDLAYLPYMSFEGATKRNRPNVNVGDVVFCQVVDVMRATDPEMPELSCIDGFLKSRGMGILPPDGYCFEVPQSVARKILSENCSLFPTLKTSLSFEVTVGENGRVYVRAATLKDMIVVSNSILLCEHMTDEQIKRAVPLILSKA